VRAGAHALSLLSVPLNVQVVEALGREPRPLIDLRRAVGSPAQTTMRAHLRKLTEMGILERRRQSNFPGSVTYALGPAGAGLLEVAASLRAWLALSPEGPIDLGSPAAKGSVKALVDGWCSVMIRAIAARPLSLTALNRLISSLNYPSLERRLVALRLAGLVEACPDPGRTTPYAATEWLRRAMAPLTVATRWEMRHSAGTPPTKIDIEALLLLAVPMARFAPEIAGACRLVMEVGKGGGASELAGAMVRVEEGSVSSCTSQLKGEASGWASGSTSAWIRALIDGDATSLEVGGDCALAMATIDGLHTSLFRVPQPA
jgi:DNA-binding HxlR family transcriptional regulator